MRKLLFASLLLTSPTLAQSTTQLWIDNCAKCHGDQAQGGGAGTRSLLTPDKRAHHLDRPFFDAIKQGVPDNGMEPFGEVLDDPTIWALVVHIRELQAKAARASTPKPTTPYQTQHLSYTLDTILAADAKLDTPWAIDWLPDGAMLLTERPGKLRLFKDHKLSDPISGTPTVRNQGQGGLLDVSVHPDYATNGWIYLSFSDPLANNGFTKIVRGKLTDGKWTDEQTIFKAKDEHYSGGGVHFGCHIVFDGKGHLFFGIGERGIGNRAQDLNRPNGKIYRLNDDGTIPSDNPFVGQAGAYEAIWSFGHRNPQGLVFDPKGNLWDTEHGPRGGDELNVIEKGRNYGWPVVSFGINYNDTKFTVPWPGEKEAGKNIRMPVDRWLPSIGACGLDVVKGEPFKQWEGDLLAGGLSGNNVDRIRLAQEGGEWKVVEREEVVFGLGRVRDVRCGPDGLIYVVLNGPDKVVRLMPVKK